jgi:hypothetical protein
LVPIRYLRVLIFYGHQARQAARKRQERDKLKTGAHPRTA